MTYAIILQSLKKIGLWVVFGPPLYFSHTYMDFNTCNICLKKL